MALKIVWPAWEDIVNDSFLPLVGIVVRYLILYGGRGSSKSHFVADQLIFYCLYDKFFRCLMLRKEKVTVRGSCYRTIKDRIIGLGLESAFIFRDSRMEIECKNGNIFVAMGVDEPAKIKSFTDPTCCWFEEDVPDEDSFITISTSVRTPKADRLIEIFSINPEVKGEDHTDNWFWKRFFDGWYPGELHHSGEVITEEVSKKTGKLERFVSKFHVHHSDYTHNVWLPDDFGRELERLSEINEYWHTVYCKGFWGRRDVTERFYRFFTRKDHIMPCGYRPELPLHISYDFNVNPYISIVVTQIVAKIVYVIDEIAAKDPHNTTEEASKLFKDKYIKHNAGLFIYGDPSGRKEDTSREKGHNDYRQAKKALVMFRPQKRVARKAPSVTMRGQFINAILKRQEAGIRIMVDPSCKHVITDFFEVRSKPDGGKHKRQIIKDGLRFEQFGHHSDAFDYLMCYFFRAEYDHFRNHVPEKSENVQRERINVQEGYYPAVVKKR